MLGSKLAIFLSHSRRNGSLSFGMWLGINTNHSLDVVTPVCHPLTRLRKQHRHNVAFNITNNNKSAIPIPHSPSTPHIRMVHHFHVPRRYRLAPHLPHPRLFSTLLHRHHPIHPIHPLLPHPSLASNSTFYPLTPASFRFTLSHPIECCFLPTPLLAFATIVNGTSGILIHEYGLGEEVAGTTWEVLLRVVF